MGLGRLAAIIVAVFVALPVQAQVRCGAFTAEPLNPPAPRTDPGVVSTFNRINVAVKTQPYRTLYIGDSITERWQLPLWDAKPVWDANMVPRGVLNAGVSGDRTEHVLWRLDHGNLDGPPPKGVILMIGTNDLGHGRSPELAAQGVRAILIRLREKLPNSRILLQGIWPRGATPTDHLREEVSAVNRLIQTCADGATIVYADIGGVLLESNGQLTRTISPDLLHFTGTGYERIAPKLDPLIDQLIGPR